MPKKILFCDQCGTKVNYGVPNNGDDKTRAICPNCKIIHYQNPINVVGTIPETKDGKVLLCKRNIEPRFGKWTLPAGFLELGESLENGAKRETSEEARANIKLGKLFSIINVLNSGQVHFFYKAELINEKFNPGYETIEIKLFKQNEIPWEELSFKTVILTLKNYFQNKNQLISLDI